MKCGAPINWISKYFFFYDFFFWWWKNFKKVDHTGFVAVNTHDASDGRNGPGPHIVVANLIRVTFGWGPHFYKLKQFVIDQNNGMEENLWTGMAILDDDKQI